MILTSNFVQRLNTTKSFTWHQSVHIKASCSHFVTSSAFFNSFCLFPTSIKRSSGPWLFQDILLREKIFLIFFFFILKSIFSVQNIASVNLQKLFLQFSLYFPTKSEKKLVLGCVSYVGSPSTMTNKETLTLKVKVIVIHLYNLHP